MKDFVLKRDHWDKASQYRNEFAFQYLIRNSPTFDPTRILIHKWTSRFPLILKDIEKTCSILLPPQPVPSEAMSNTSFSLKCPSRVCRYTHTRTRFTRFRALAITNQRDERKVQKVQLVRTNSKKTLASCVSVTKVRQPRHGNSGPTGARVGARERHRTVTLMKRTAALTVGARKTLRRETAVSGGSARSMSPIVILVRV